MATVRFLKAGTPYGWSYLAGEVGTIPGEAAAQLAADGVVEILGLAEAQAPAHEHRETKIRKPKEVRKA